MRRESAIVDAVADELRDCSGRVRALLEQASTLSETEVVAAGRRIGEMRRESGENVRALDELARQFGGSQTHGQGNLEAAVRTQAGAVADFAKRLSGGIEEQQAATSGMHEVSRKIGAFVATIEGLAQELRILTLNARLEAAHWGQQGAAFATVASSMNELTRQVRLANEQIGEHAATLSEITERVAASEAKLGTLGRELVGQSDQQMHALLTAYQVASGASAAAVDGGATRARRILALSNDMLTNLQFQDRMVQVFAEVNSVVASSEKVTCEFLEAVPSEPDPCAAMAVLAGVRSRFGNSAVRMSGESELSASDHAMQSGVVELF